MSTPEFIRLDEKVESLTGNMGTMKTDMIEIKNQLKEIHHALIGNNMGQEGLVSRVEKLERTKKTIENKLTWATGYIFGASTLAVAIVELIKYFFLK